MRADKNGPIIHKNCSTTVLLQFCHSSILQHIQLGYVFWSSSSMYACKCLGVRLSLFLINLSSSFDNNNDNDCIIKPPVGNRRLKIFFCAIYIRTCMHIYLLFFLVYVWRLEQRWKDWLVIRRRVFVCVHKWPFPVLAINVYILLPFTFFFSLNNPWGTKKWFDQLCQPFISFIIIVFFFLLFRS